jgi:hypothetical protein
MEQKASWESDSSSESREILRILLKPKIHYRVENSPPIVPYPESNQSGHVLYPVSWRSILVLYSDLP